MSLPFPKIHIERAMRAEVQDISIQVGMKNASNIASRLARSMLSVLPSNNYFHLNLFDCEQLTRGISPSAKIPLACAAHLCDSRRMAIAYPLAPSAQKRIVRPATSALGESRQAANMPLAICPTGSHVYEAKNQQSKVDKDSKACNTQQVNQTDRVSNLFNTNLHDSHMEALLLSKMRTSGSTTQSCETIKQAFNGVSRDQESYVGRLQPSWFYLPPCSEHLVVHVPVAASAVTTGVFNLPASASTTVGRGRIKERGAPVEIRHLIGCYLHMSGIISPPLGRFTRRMLVRHLELAIVRGGGDSLSEVPQTYRTTIKG